MTRADLLRDLSKTNVLPPMAKTFLPMALNAVTEEKLQEGIAFARTLFAEIKSGNTDHVKQMVAESLSPKLADEIFPATDGH